MSAPVPLPPTRPAPRRFPALARLTVRLPLFVGLVVLASVALVGSASIFSTWFYMERQVDVELNAILDNGLQNAEQLAQSAKDSQQHLGPDPNGDDDIDRPRDFELHRKESDWGQLQVATRAGVTSSLIVHNFTVSSLSAAALESINADLLPHPQTVTLPEIGQYRIATMFMAPVLTTSGLQWQRVADFMTAKRAFAEDDSSLLRLTVGVPLGPQNNMLESMAWRMIGLAAAGALLAILATTWITRRQLRPLARVAGVAKAVTNEELTHGDGALSARVEAADADPDTEVGKVGQALNVMLDHVDSALQARASSEARVRQFVADASHELRTPLAAVSGYAELLTRIVGEDPDAGQAAGRIRSEAARMADLVEDLLLLARLDSGRPLESQSVDMAAICVDSLADAHVTGASHRWNLDLPLPDLDDIELEGADLDQGPAEVSWPAFVPAVDRALGGRLLPGPLEVQGDELRLRQIIANLLTNARQHTPEGTAVTLAARRWSGPTEHILVWVHDDGPGVAPEIRESVFDRFTRADSARAAGQSTGLGLSIVKAVAAALGGQVRLLNDPPGAGTTFEIALPAAPAGA